jgi:RNA polymerase sigma factor (sigma-70 family)
LNTLPLAPGESGSMLAPLIARRELSVAQTPPSLLNRLREHPDDAGAWLRFDDLYRPLLQTWLRRYAVQCQDADDLVQQVLEVVVREMPRFHYEPAKGRFRAWLRSIMVNQLRAFWRSQQSRPKADSKFFDHILEQLEDEKSDLSRLWDQEHDQHVSRRLLALIEPDFSPTTWQAFRRLMDGAKAKGIAADLGISANAVYLAKSSVIKRLREEIEGLTD